MENAPESEEYYRTGYLKTSLHGIWYQIKISMWMIWNLRDRDDWYLAAEMPEAGEFHDLVLKFKVNKKNENKVMHRFMQIKHQLDPEIFELNIRTLTSKDKNKHQFSLTYLFESYLNILNNFKIKREQIKDLIIFTNVKIIDKIGLLKSSEVNVSEICFRGKGKQYQIDISKIKEEQDKEGPMKILMTKLRDCQSKDEDEDKKNEIIYDFLKKLLFMVNQPMESELEKLINESIATDLQEDIVMSEIYYNKLYKKMYEWYKFYVHGKAKYFTKQDLGSIISSDIYSKLENLKLDK